MKKKNYYKTLLQAILGIAVICQIIFYMLNYFQPSVIHNMTPLRQGWQQQDPTTHLWRDLDDFPSHIESKACDVLQIRRTLEPISDEHSALMVVGIHQRLEVFWEDLLLYEYWPSPAGTDPGTGLHFVFLPKSDQHHTLTINVSSPYAIFANELQPIYLDNIAVLQTYIVRRSLLPLIFAFVCMCSGFFLLYFRFYPRIPLQNAGQTYFGAFFVSNGECTS